MYPNNYNYAHVPPGSSGAGYPYMQQPVPPMIPPPFAQPIVPPGYNEHYEKWAQWNSRFPVNPTTTWRQQAAAAVRPTPYDRPVAIQHQVPYGGRPYVPRDMSGPNANTMRGPPVPASLNQTRRETEFYNNVAPNLEFDVHVASTRLHIVWKAPHVSGQVSYELSVTEGRSLPFTLDFPHNHTSHSLRVKAGESYLISISAKKLSNGVIVAKGQRTIKAIFSDAELRQLYDKAVRYTGTRMHPFQLLYRCKPKPYWDDIHHNCSNVMEKYMKDDNGQPGNMINGVISGLFFSARLLPNGTLPTSSPFGNVRMLIQAIMFLDPSSVNIYFADFYCNKQAHYVTIIVARKGSESDVYSQKYLLPLNLETNPWLRVQLRPVGNELKFFFYAACSVWVEILYTENVPLSWGRFDKIAATGLGTSKIGGLSNNKACTICNLYPPGRAADATADEDEERGYGAARDAVVSRRGERTAEQYAEEEERRYRQERRERRSRSFSPARSIEDKENQKKEPQEEEEEEPVNEEDNLDGIELPAYEMGGNSTFQTLINIHNVHDCPNWTDLIECVCEVVDCVVMMDKQEREREITSFNSSCDSRVERAIEEMDSVVGSCDDDKIHDLAAEVHELHEWWQRARDELSKLADAHEKREADKRAAAAAQAPPPQRKDSAASRNSIKEEEDLDEYLEDDVITTQSAQPVNLTPSAMLPLPVRPATVTPKAPSRAATVTHPSPGSIPLPDTPTATVTPKLFPGGPIVFLPSPASIPLPETPPTTVTPKWFPGVATITHPSPASIPLPETPVAPVSESRPKKERKKKERPVKKEEELDEYLDDDETPVKDTVPTQSTVKEEKVEVTVATKIEKTTVAIKVDTVEIKKEIKQEEVDDIFEDSAIDLSLFDEVGNATISATPATTPKGTVAASSKSIEGEDEWLDDEVTVIDLKRHVPDGSSKPVVSAKKAKQTVFECIDLTEDELLAPGPGPCSFVDITPEMEAELLGSDSGES